MSPLMLVTAQPGFKMKINIQNYLKRSPKVGSHTKKSKNKNIIKIYQVVFYILGNPLSTALTARPYAIDMKNTQSTYNQKP